LAVLIADIYELSPIQAGMLFHRVFAAESTAYFDQFSCRLTGAVQPELLRKAWQQLVDRHPTFRTSFHWEGLDKPVQVVHTQAKLPWDALDWRAVAPAAQAARWHEYLAADRARGFEPDVVPLMRAAIVRISEGDYYFCWSHHHLLLDGWCLTLVLSELFARYEALTQGRQPQLPPVRPYSEYIKWLQHRDVAALEGYWRDSLRGLSSPTLLGTSVGHGPTGHGQADATVLRDVSESLTAGLRALAARHRLTLNTLIQGAWAMLLSRYGATDDVVFGATVSGRPPDVPGIETMLGVFINTVPVRLQVKEDVSASAWLANVQARHVAREPFAAILLSDIQKLSEIEPGTPLFDTNVIVMNYRMDEALAGGAAGLTISDLRIVDQTDIPLTLQVTPGRRLMLAIVYDSARFDAGAVTRMLGHVEHLLAQFEQDLDRPLAAFEIVTPAERSQLFDVFNATKVPLDPSKTAIHLWEERAAATPDATALECDDVRLTFRELNQRANRLARGLQTLAPLGPDALIAIAFTRSEKLVVAILAVWKCGAAYIPIDPDYPADRIRQVLDTASPQLVLREPGTLDESLETAFADRIRFSAFDEVEVTARGLSRDNLDRPATGSDLAYVIFTSGSTGQPKGAMVEQVGMLNHILAKIEDFGLDKRSIIVQNASHCFDISVWQCFAALLAGGRTIVYTDALVIDPVQFLERVRTDRVTVLEVVPSYLAALLDRFEDDPRPFPDLQFLLVTGETVKPSLVERWFTLLPSIPMANAYGPTEASDDVTHAIMREPPATATVPIGRPLRNCHIYIADERLRLCPIGVPGELCVSGPGVGRGYLHDPARTAAAFLEDPFRSERGVRMYRTGDVGWFTADGMLLLAGRKDHQVKVRGYRIELGDIEAALTGLDAVRDAAVVDRRDRAADGAYLAAYVSLRDQEATAEQILEALAARLPEYMIPATCTVLPELPLTPNGKLDRKALPAPHRSSRPTGTTYAAPRTSEEQALAGIWGDVLSVERPGIHDNFFAVGGDSILSMQIVSRAARAGFALTPRDVFQHQTIAELAAVARPSQTRTHAASRRAPGPAPLTPAQQQFFEDVTVDRHHYNQSILLEVPAGFDADRCRRALDLVVQNHEALRLRFAEVDGVWQQTVAAAEASPRLEVHDFSGMPVDQRRAAVDESGGRTQASLDIEHGPLLRGVLFDHGVDEPGRLLVVIHHLAVDGVSWRVLFEDLAVAYDALGRSGDVVLPPVATPYLEWADAQVAPPAVVPSEPSYDRALNTVDSAAETMVVFDETTTRGFLNLTSQAYKTGPTEVLLAATAVACAEWTGSGRVLVDLERHGRDVGAGLDVTRTVGWFTSTAPVLIDLPSGELDPAESVAIVKAQLRTAPAALPRPGILLNYHGRIDLEPRSDWRLSSDPHGPARSPRQRREYLLEINALVSDARLRVTVAYSRNLHSPETIALLAQQLEQQVVALIDRARTGHAARLTPADVPAARLDEAALEGLLARVPDPDDIYELSPTQQGLLFHALYEQTAGAYFNQLTCVLQGGLDTGAFREAWHVVAARHPALRTSFHWKALERPVQVVHPRADIPWVIEDWSALLAEEQEHRWAALGEDDRRSPFDLSSPPLMRCALARIGKDAYRFRWSQHHLLLDGWSSSIVLNDVLSAYDAIVRGQRFDPPVPPRFRENILWLQQQDDVAAERFWRAQLDGFASPTPLVIGLPEMDGTVQAGRFGEAELTIPDALGSRLKSLAAANHITLNTLFHGVWSILLSRYSGESDIVFGSIASGRSSALEQSDAIVGLFINTVPVRARVDADAPLFAWLRDLQRDNAEREVYSYSSLADVQRWSAVAGGTALFETILIFENYPVAESLAAAGHSVSVTDVTAFEPNNYPMTFVVTPGESIGLKVMFDAGRFDRATIDRTLGHVSTILNGIADSPDSRIGALPVMTAAERARLDAWNETAKPVPAGETVLGPIEAHALRTPTSPAVMCDGRVVTYGEINARANQLARVLLASGRLSHEARVVVLLRRSELLPETILALWKCGVAYVPVDPDYPAERISTIIAKARAEVVVASGAELGAARVAALRQEATLVLLDEIGIARRRESDRNLDALRDPASLAYVIFTSGSTGVPKGAMVEHAGLLNHVLSMIDELALGSSSVVAQTASHCFDISMWQLFAALVAGGTTAIYPEAVVHRPEQLAARIQADRVSVAQFVPSYLNVFLDGLETAGNARPALPALVHMVVIGEALKTATIDRWFRLYPHIPLMNAYGPTEASDSVAHFDLTRPLGAALVPIGRPIQNLALHIVDPAMRLCPVGVKGEICIAGIGVGRGYLFDEARTRDAFLQDPFSRTPRRMYRTGDVGCSAPDGTILFFGRRDHQVKIRGHRIELGEVESCLAAVDGVRDAAVVTREGSDGDRVLCAYVTAKAGYTLSEDAVARALAERLPDWAVPDALRVLPEMPVMSNGKVDRRSLTARALVRAGTAASSTPATDTERALARIWSEVLGHGEVGVDQSFFDLGGHSLKAIQIVSRVTRDHGADIAIGDVFERGTIRRLAQLMDARSTAGSPPLVAQPPQEHYDTSPTQRRMWLASRTPEGSAAYNMAGTFWLDGAVDVPALARAFRTLVERHEALRTVFVIAAGSLRQQVQSGAAVGEVLRETGWTSDPPDSDALDAAIQERISSPFDLARGPLFDAELLRFADRRSLLLVRLHHIVGDAGSIAIVLREAVALYAAFRRGDAAAALPPLEVQYRDFVAWQNTQAADGTRDESRRYWLDRLSAEMPHTAFTPDAPGAAPSALGLIATCDVDEALTARLRSLASRRGTTFFGVIVSAVYALLFRYSQHGDLVIGTTVSRRDHPLLEHQVGCYIDTLVLRGQTGGRDTAAQLLDRTARVCTDALAHRDYPFESLLEELQPVVPEGKTPLFDVLVDYVPGPGAVGGTDEHTGLAISERPRTAEAAHYDTMFLVTESDSGATLSIQVVFKTGLFTADTVDLARTRLHTILRWLADDGEGTLGEVELLSLHTLPRRRLHISLKTC